MTSSYERVNYVLRPAKHVERGMIVEALQRLRVLYPLRRYRYIGFGSTYFADFTLVHRTLGIKQMISIEQDEGNKERFLFNRPFRTVDMRFGTSNEWLPKLSWKTPSIVWLDYDGPLTSAVLTDVDWVCSSAPAGSVLIVTVNANPAPVNPDAPGRRVQKLREDVGREYVPNGVTNDGHLGGWRLAEVAQTILDGTIREAARDRSTRSERISYEPLFNFQYRDTTRMLTVGGILLDEKQKAELPRCSFGDLDYTRTDSTAYRIVVPFLTNREVRWLDRQLPAKGGRLTTTKIPVQDCDAYAKVYRFFPNFVNAEF
jgi:hypothetical protein